MQPPGLAQQGLLGQLAQVRAGGELLDRVHDDGGLFGGDEAVAQRVAGRGALGDEELGVAHGAAAGAGVGAGEVGVPVPGGGPRQLLFGDLAVLDLGERGGLRRRRGARAAARSAAAVSTISSGLLAAQRVSSREPSTAFAAAATAAGLFGGNVVLSMGPWKHRPPTVGGCWPAGSHDVDINRRIVRCHRLVEERAQRASRDRVTWGDFAFVSPGLEASRCAPRTSTNWRAGCCGPDQRPVLGFGSAGATWRGTGGRVRGSPLAGGAWY